MPILSTKHQDHLPPRVLRFHLRLARFNYTIMHTPVKLLYTADTLSRTPQPTEDHDLLDEAESFVEAIVSTLPATTQQLDAYRKAQAGTLSQEGDTTESPRGTPRDVVILNLEQVTAYQLPRVVGKWSGYQWLPSRLSVSRRTL